MSIMSHKSYTNHTFPFYMVVSVGLLLTRRWERVMKELGNKTFIEEGFNSAWPQQLNLIVIGLKYILLF